MKDFKIFYGAQTLIYKIIQPPPPPPRQNFPRFWNKVFFTELYRNIDIFLSSAWRMQFLGVYKWCSANVCWRICKMSEVIGCVTEVYFLLQC